jgi:hypothetical protein
MADGSDSVKARSECEIDVWDDYGNGIQSVRRMIEALVYIDEKLDSSESSDHLMSTLKAIGVLAEAISRNAFVARDTIRDAKAE